jgi:hypothetical protein
MIFQTISDSSEFNRPEFKSVVRAVGSCEKLKRRLSSYPAATPSRSFRGMSCSSIKSTIRLCGAVVAYLARTLSIVVPPVPQIAINSHCSAIRKAQPVTALNDDVILTLVHQHKPLVGA